MMAREPVVRSQTVSRLSIFPESAADGGARPAEPLLVSHDPLTIRQELGQRGIGFERWPVRTRLPQGADQTTVLRAFRTDVERVLSEAEHASVDALRVTPNHPDKDSLRRRFLSEHTQRGRGAFLWKAVGCSVCTSAGKCWPFCVNGRSDTFQPAPATGSTWVSSRSSAFCVFMAPMRLAGNLHRGSDCGAIPKLGMTSSPRRTAHAVSLCFGLIAFWPAQHWLRRPWHDASVAARWPGSSWREAFDRSLPARLPMVNVW